MPFTSSSLMVSNFAVCGIPFLAGFYSKNFILEMFSMRYVNIFGFFLLFVSAGLTACYSGFEPAKPVRKQPQTYAVDRAVSKLLGY